MWCGVFIGIIEVVAVGIAAWNDAIATVPSLLFGTILCYSCGHSRRTMIGGLRIDISIRNTLTSFGINVTVRVHKLLFLPSVAVPIIVHDVVNRNIITGGSSCTRCGRSRWNIICGCCRRRFRDVLHFSRMQRYTSMLGVIVETIPRSLSVESFDIFFFDSSAFGSNEVTTVIRYIWTNRRNMRSVI